MKSNRKVSVILAGYNEEAILKKSILRIVERMDHYFLQWELILIDDASKDGTYLIMKYFADKYQNIRLLENRVNLNFGISVLRGLKAARYDYVIYNACDLPLSPEDMSNVILRMQKNTDILVLERKTYKAVKWRKVTSFINRLFLKILFPVLSRGTPDLNFVQVYKRQIIDQILPLARSPIFVWPELVFRAKLMKLEVRNIRINFHVENTRNGAFGHPHDIIWGIYDMLRFRMRLWKKDV